MQAEPSAWERRRWPHRRAQRPASRSPFDWPVLLSAAVARKNPKIEMLAKETAPPPSLVEHALASLSDAVVLTDGQDRIVLFNQAAQELTGFSEGYAIGRSCAEVFRTSPAIPNLVERARASGQSQSCGEELLHLYQRSIAVRLGCSPVRGQNADVEGCALVIQDLSYQKKLEEDVRRHETLAQLGGLVAGLAHEIKNPLGGIRGAAQLLARKITNNTDVTTCTGVMIREIDRLSQLVEQLLTFGAAPTPEPHPVNLHVLLRDALDVLGTELAAKSISVRLEIDPSLPDTQGDAALLTSVFLNLVKNSMEAMPAGGTITVLTRVETDYHILRHAAAGKFLRVEISDTGPGFPAAVLPRIFEPFFTTKARGTGLGLAVCERIIAVHGGDIRAENRMPQGAAITINLPVYSA